MSRSDEGKMSSVRVRMPDDDVVKDPVLEQPNLPIPGSVHAVGFDDPSLEAPPLAAATGQTPAKYLLLEVPNFNRAETPADAMTSYLRLGSVPRPAIAGSPEAPKSTGEDLASRAAITFEDGRRGVFLDDERIRNTAAPGFAPVDERFDETAKLHTLGGWRDHSDGNRISTTRGDKIEVIRGNYKLLVLGRQDEAKGAAGWDVSGGHTEGLGVKSSIEWVQTFGGTWKTLETSEKGDTWVTQHGNSESHHYGEHMISTTGSEDERRPVYDPYRRIVRWDPAPNPEISERTWARSIESHTGSSGNRVPHIQNETWADDVASVTQAHSISDATTADSITSATNAGAVTSTTNAGAITDTTIAGAQTAMNIIGAMTNINVGNSLMVNVGATENINVGAMLDVTVAASARITMGASLDVTMGVHSSIELGGEVELAPDRNLVVGTSNEVAGMKTTVAGMYNVLAGIICLG
jgi:hypothetical protein